MSQRLIVCMDLDGVITDWLNPTLTALGVDSKDPKVRETIVQNYNGLDKLAGSREQVDNKLAERGWEFWYNLNFLPWAQRLFDKVRETVGDDLVFVTSPGKWADGAKGKILWQQKYFPNVPIIICRHKNWVSGPNKYLIDDDPAQVERWVNGGGFAWKWPAQYYLEDQDSTFWDHLIFNVCEDIQLVKSVINKRER